MKVEQMIGGRYELLDQLGSGGMAVVWRARDAVLGRSVAVKLLAGPHAADPLSRQGIRDEARAAATLSHPNIAQVYDFGESHEGDEYIPYVVMELVPGQTLAEHMADGPLPADFAFRVCAEVAAALSAAHADGLVHRDIKPANVMVTPAGAKVVDFGIAAAVRPGGTGAISDELVGTPAYLAPERLTGDAVEPASDVYALGVMLYRLLSGHSPWTVDSTTKMLAAHVYIDPMPLPQLPDVPDRVTELCNQCLSKEPSLRPSAREVATLLAQAAGFRVVHQDASSTQTSMDLDAATSAVQLADAPTPPDRLRPAAPKATGVGLRRLVAGGPGRSGAKRSGKDRPGSKRGGAAAARPPSPGVPGAGVPGAGALGSGALGSGALDLGAGSGGAGSPAAGGVGGVAAGGRSPEGKASKRRGLSSRLSARRRVMIGAGTGALLVSALALTFAPMRQVHESAVLPPPGPAVVPSIDPTTPGGVADFGSKPEASPSAKASSTPAKTPTPPPDGGGGYDAGSTTGPEDDPDDDPLEPTDTFEPPDPPVLEPEPQLQTVTRRIGSVDVVCFSDDTAQLSNPRPRRPYRVVDIQTAPQFAPVVRFRLGVFVFRMQVSCDNGAASSTVASSRG